MGGYVASEFALAHPDRVDRLVLMGPGGLAVSLFNPDPSEGARRLTEFMLNPSRPGMVAWVDCMVANKKVVDDALIDERLANALVPGAIDSALSIFMSLQQFPEPVPLYVRAEQLKVPTLITWGRDDRMLPFEQALFSFRRLPRAELHVFSLGVATGPKSSGRMISRGLSPSSSPDRRSRPGRREESSCRSGPSDTSAG